MILFKKSDELANYIQKLKGAGNSIGFVPTMGALHAGHLSLVEASLQNNDHTVCSIFINPTQFNDSQDFRKYPVTIEQDIDMLETCGTSILFLPDVSEIYRDGTAQLPHYELGKLDQVLEGHFRPGHFQGVCQVMSRLLSIVAPQHLYMGLKDYQQCLVVKRLLTILASGTTLIACNTLREQDGLAMSSRNMRLNEQERAKAPAIYKLLNFLKENVAPGSVTDLQKKAKTLLQQQQLRPDYVQIADANTLESVDVWDGKQELVALVAAFINEVRLIDNMVIRS